MALDLLQKFYLWIILYSAKLKQMKVFQLTIFKIEGYVLRVRCKKNGHGEALIELKWKVLCVKD